MSTIFLIGAGGHGKVVAEIAEQCGYLTVVFLDRFFPEQISNGPWPVVGNESDWASLLKDGHTPFVSIGSNKTRQSVYSQIGGDESPVLTHAGSQVSRYSRVGAGTVIMAGTVLNAGSDIGKGAILNTGSTVDHDCILGDFVHISPGAHLAGGVKVGERSWVGIGAIIKEGIVIGKDVIVAAGAVVIKDIADGAQVMGVPANPVQK